MWFLSGMKALVALEVRELRECVAALFADIWFLASMDPIVLLERAVLRELLAASVQETNSMML